MHATVIVVALPETVTRHPSASGPDLRATVSEILAPYEGTHWDYVRVGDPMAETWFRGRTASKPVSRLTDQDLDRAHAVVVDEYGWFARERFEPWKHPGFTPQELPPLAWIHRVAKDGLAIIVDVHH